jgi:Fe2+ or Zn2+ uptake regulation protein
MSEINRFKEILNKSGNFATKQRLELFKYMQAHPEISIKKLVTQLPSQDQATIYRNIKLFESLGVVNRLQLGWNSRLELSSRFHDHHHHMTCTNCGKVIAWEEDPAIELRIQTVALKLGFLPQDHQLEIRGLCQSCQRSEKF